MAVSSDGSGSNNFVRSATLPNKTPITVRAWVKRLADRGNYSAWAALNKSGDELFYCGTTNDGEALSLYAGSDFDVSGDTTVIDGAWHHIVYTYDGTTGTIYVDGASVFSDTLTQDGAAAVSFTVLTTDFGSWWDGAVEAVAVWEDCLDATEVLDDMDYLEPQLTTNLWAFWPLDDASDVADASGNSRDLTAVGAPTTVTGSGTPYAPTPPSGNGYAGFFALAF